MNSSVFPVIRDLPIFGDGSESLVTMRSEGFERPLRASLCRHQVRVGVLILGAAILNFVVRRSAGPAFRKSEAPIIVPLAADP